MERDMEMQAKLRNRKMKQEKRRKSVEEGKTGVQKQLRRKVALEYGSVCGVKGDHGLPNDRRLVTTGGGRGRLLSQRRRNRGFHDPLRIRPSSLFILLGWSTN
jgi:hypothetical protein